MASAESKFILVMPCKEEEEEEVFNP